MPNKTARLGKSSSDAEGGIFQEEEVRCAMLGVANITAPITTNNPTRMTAPISFP